MCAGFFFFFFGGQVIKSRTQGDYVEIATSLNWFIKKNLKKKSLNWTVTFY